MSNKTITIQQGTGDDALEMTVQVTQEELDKMEEIRSNDPSAWEGRGLDLVKAAKDAVTEASEENAQPQKCTNWKLILGITLGVLAIIGIIIFAEKSRNREQEVSQKQEINNAGAVEQWIKSECVEVNRRRIYETLKENNMSVVPESFNVFSKAMDNQSYRDWAYEEALQQKLKIGTKEAFELAMTQPNSDIFRCIFEIASYFGMPDSEEDMVSYLKESEENRKKFYNKLLEVGMPNGFDEFDALLNYSQNNRQQFSEDNMREIYNKLIEWGASGTYEDFISYFEENDANRRHTFEYFLDKGYPATYDQFLGYAGYIITENSNVSDLFNVLCEKGAVSGSYEEFLRWINNSENRSNLYNKLKEKGAVKGPLKDFESWLGLGKNNNTKSCVNLDKIRPSKKEFCVIKDWQSILSDFIATKEAKPNLTKEEWFERFPEFNNDEKLLQAAFDYDATVKSGKYFDENELRSKFPEFWPNTKFMLSGDNISSLYNYLKQENLLAEGSEADFRAWLDIKSNRVYLYNELKNRNSISHNSIKEFDEWLDYTSISEKTGNDLKKYTSSTYNFTIQYDDKEFQLVEKQNKNSHCVMKLQSPNDEVKSMLVSVWDNSEFSSSYDIDFIASCQSVDEEMGKVISSAVKSKIDGVNALKSELIISPMGKSYYAAIYRIIHKKRMYMLNIYIPMEEYNKDKSYGDKCANNFKFN